MLFCYSSLNRLKQWPNFGLVTINQEDNACKTLKQKVTVLYAADSDDEIRTVSVSRSAPLWGRSINPDMLQRAGMVWFNLLNSSL